MRGHVSKRWWGVCIPLMVLSLIGMTTMASPVQNSPVVADLVKDIENSTVGSFPSDITPTEQGFYFVASGPRESISRPAANRILWFSDGTEAGTRAIKDVGSGEAGSGPDDLIMVGNRLFFSARNGESRRSLWTSDGTTAGTYMVANIIPGGSDGTSGHLTAMNGTLFFLSTNFDGVLGLWKSDGSPGNAELVKELSQGFRGNTDMIAIQNVLYFATPVTDGYRLWRSDGTSEGTVLITYLEGTRSQADLTMVQNDLEPTIPAPPPPGPDIMTISALTNVNGTLFFRGYDAEHGHELWTSDGTYEGTRLVVDAVPGAEGIFPKELTPVGPTLFFVGEDEQSQPGLWRSDGTPEGTQLVRVFPVNQPPGHFTPVNNDLFFSAITNETDVGQELWISDGTAVGTRMVKDILPGSLSSASHELVNVGGILFFVASDGQPGGHKLWSSDGTEAGTALVKDIFPNGNAGPQRLANVNDQLFFAAMDRSSGIWGEGDVELWRSDGTEEGTTRVKDINTYPKGSNLSGFAQVGDYALFTAKDELLGFELWRTDGTPEGTRLVKDIAPGIADSLAPVTEMVEFKGQIFFSTMYIGDDRSGLWQSDGTEAGTTQVLFDKRFVWGVDNMKVMEDTLYFTSTGYDSDSNKHSFLWASDGTANGTIPIKQFKLIETVIYTDDTIWLAADDGQTGLEVWRSDGTEEGTTLMKDICPGNQEFGSINGFADMGNAVIFAADDAQRGPELWRSDGTPSGTTLVKDIVAGAYGSNPEDFTVMGDYVFFTAGTFDLHRELWMTDGTAEGTRLVKDINPGAEASNPSWLTVMNGRLFFTANGPEQYGLWVSDGTDSGTYMIAELREPLSPTDATNLTTVDGIEGIFFFSEWITADQWLLWRSDGTSEGTMPVWRSMPGSTADYIYNPEHLFLLNDTLLFSASDDQAGEELWSMPAYADVAQTVYLPQLLGAPPASEFNLPIRYMNVGRTTATDVQVTATMDDALAYVSDTSDSTPTIDGERMVWDLPDIGYLDGAAWNLRVRVPEAPYGTRYRVTVEIMSAEENHHAVPNLVEMELMVARQTALPIVSR
ncbi:MAG: hypothetical protein GFH25_541276n10 [Chloroflexi bacterium AL-N10]|nr:hypothetical protein [Chloroflexi bacterium AL-N1]NOK71091.1 hypothetical protein [Chloroflexi bacterium AL-N10]NOK77338.1 hypothetical protein [Chloroflexi bacterium AL-N5]